MTIGQAVADALARGLGLGTLLYVCAECDLDRVFAPESEGAPCPRCAAPLGVVKIRTLLEYEEDGRRGVVSAYQSNLKGGKSHE